MAVTPETAPVGTIVKATTGVGERYAKVGQNLIVDGWDSPPHPRVRILSPSSTQRKASYRADYRYLDPI